MFRVGSAQVNITPDHSIELAGSFHVRRTDRVFSPLFASALVVEGDDQSAAWVACDLLFLSDEMAAELRQRIAENIRIPPDHVFIGCTHTHNGPSLFRCLPPLDPDIALAERIKDRIVQSAVLAAGSRQKACMGYAQGEASATFNRRYLKTNGKAWMGPGPQDTDIVGREGPEDQQVQVVWFEAPSGRLIGLLVNFSAHATTTFGESVMSADFPGEIRRVLQAVHGPDVPVVYLQGACGNTSPVDFDHPDQTPLGLDGAVRVGQLVGGEVIKIMARSARNLVSNPTVVVGRTVIEIPTRGLGEEDPAPEAAAAFLREHPWESLDHSDWRPTIQWYFADCMVQMEREKRASWLVEVSVLRLGPVVLAANPAELFVEYQLEIKNRAGLPVLISELTNGYCGYVITERAWKNGSYEARRAFSSKLDPIGGTKIVETTLQLIKKACEP